MFNLKTEWACLLSIAQHDLIFDPFFLLFTDNFHLAAQPRDPQPRPAPASRRQCASIRRRSTVDGQKLAEIRPFNVLQASAFTGRFDQVASSTIPL